MKDDWMNFAVCFALKTVLVTTAKINSLLGFSATFPVNLFVHELFVPFMPIIIYLLREYLPQDTSLYVTHVFNQGDWPR